MDLVSDFDVMSNHLDTSVHSTFRFLLIVTFILFCFLLLVYLFAWSVCLSTAKDEVGNMSIDAAPEDSTDGNAFIAESADVDADQNRKPAPAKGNAQSNKSSPKGANADKKGGKADKKGGKADKKGGKADKKDANADKKDANAENQGANADKGANGRKGCSWSWSCALETPETTTSWCSGL
jgi:hypothetical protein